MKHLPALALLCAATLTLLASAPARAQHAGYDAMVATHAEANGLPEALIHRVIKRESGYRPHLVHNGNIGLMQIKLGTARALGYSGTAEGLRDPETNLTYAVKYLAGAFLAARGDHNRAVSYYAGGYYYVAKRQRLAHRATKPEPRVNASAVAAVPAAASAAEAGAETAAAAAAETTKP